MVRELDERLGLGKLIEEHVSDTRRGENNKVPLAVSIFGESDEAGPASG